MIRKSHINNGHRDDLPGGHPSPRFIVKRRAWQAILLMAIFFMSSVSFAGKHPHREFGMQLSKQVKSILRKHNMPVYDDRENKWFKIASGSDRWIGGNPSYGLYFYEAHEIPIAAQLEIIEYCMKIHELRGRKEVIRIQMRTEPYIIQSREPKPYFEMILNCMN